MEENSPKLFNRKNIRAKFHNYSGGDYFVTICTAEMEHFFGEVVGDEMQYTPLGKVACQCFDELPTHFPYVEVPLYVVMPNHVHAIICILDDPAVPKIRSALGVAVGGYKQAVTRYARRNDIDFDWQTRYYDHIIRDVRDGNNIANYIENNPARWAADRFHGE